MACSILILGKYNISVEIDLINFHVCVGHKFRMPNTPDLWLYQYTVVPSHKQFHCWADWLTQITALRVLYCGMMKVVYFLHGNSWQWIELPSNLITFKWSNNHYIHLEKRSYTTSTPSLWSFCSSSLWKYVSCSSQTIVGITRLNGKHAAWACIIEINRSRYVFGESVVL